ncbi:putative L-ascorbate peroxidase 6 isoform X2 [Carica papaya]|uniref:putative L-ascorbate peroxidase 6 isoform X2 n=1 Tax=Carica papaya TaxID=3649 RepID=UPI000B8C84BE|nr:putative L-ascorbate peroxidase 6 isoform X2 [Carica papaya]
MTLSIFKPSPLCSLRTSPTFQINFNSDSPAKPLRSSSPTVKYGARLLHACALPSPDDQSGKNQFCVSNRRKVLLGSTLPFLIPLERFGVQAAESGTATYSLIKEEVRKLLTKSKAAGVLRLVFHDAGTFEMDENSGGMNGSILYELDRPENSGLKKSIKILNKAKTEVDAVQPVSWADVIAVAGAEAVLVCGGPTIPVLIGRLDSM